MDISEQIQNLQITQEYNKIIKKVLSIPSHPPAEMFDYDFIVESFYTEYKLDLDELKSILLEYKNTKSQATKFKLFTKFKKLYPEFQGEDLETLSENQIPKTIKKKVWFVQPPRDEETGRPLHFYSLKSRLLTRLRDLRKEVKKLMKKAGAAGDTVNVSRYNAMQLAIKIIMNTEYGASGNKLFAHYDPDIAGAVTFLSRTLIHFLTNTLEGETFYVDKRFLEDNQQLIDRLSSIKCIHNIEKIDDDFTNEMIYKNRVRTLRRVYDDRYNVIDRDLYKISIEKSRVIYQDTDSNYYINPYIQSYYTTENLTPVDIKECMVSMLAHNDFMNNFAVGGIHRTPVGLGFEGAFIIARYFYRKKKYYGVKYDEDLLAEIPPGEKWRPHISCEPLANGDYVYLDNKILLSNNEIVAHGKQKTDEPVTIVNYLDYIKSQGIKCTGVNLARRDQYRFINYYHMVVIQNDMRIIKKNKNGEWKTINEATISDVVDDIIEMYRNVIQVYTDIEAGNRDDVPNGIFKLVDFSRPKPYDETKQGSMQKIINRMKGDEDATEYMPENGERINVVVVMNDEIRKARLKGTAGMGQTGERSFTVEELLEKTKRLLRKKTTYKYIKENPESDIAKILGDVGSYEDIKLNQCIDVELDENYVDAYACASLDFKYYLQSLAKAMALYLVDERFPEETKQINDGKYSADEAEKLVDKLQSKIGKEILDKYYPPSTKVESKIRQIQKGCVKKVTPDMKKKSAKYPYTLKYLKNMTDDEMIENNAGRIRTKIEGKLNESKDIWEHLENVYKRVETDKMINFRFRNPIEQQLYDELMDDVDLYEKHLRQASNQIFIYDKILHELENVGE